MKQIFPLLVIALLLAASCNNNNQPQKSSNATTTSNSNTTNNDSIPTGHSSSPAEFSKGNSSPAGSTGGPDSTMPTEPRNSSGRN